MEQLLLWLVLLSVFIQGGYFPTIFLLIAVLLAALVFARKKRALSPCEQALWAFAAVYLIASLAGGYRSDSLAQACLPSSCALFLYHYYGLPKKQKERLLDGVVTASGVFSGLAILALCGVIPLTGAVTDHRLQFTFQYANAAGAWFAAVLLLAQGNNGKRKRWAIPCITALLLTRSVGALGAYGVLQLYRVYQKRKEPDPWRETILLHVLAGVFAVAFFLCSDWIAIPILIALYLTAWRQNAILERAKRFHLHWVALVAACGGGVAALFSQRVMNSLSTFTERISQIKDGVAILADHPLLGIGAGNWAYLYPYYQTEQYTSTVVHSSIIQIGVDSGLVGIAVAAVFLVLAWRRRSKGRTENLAAALLLLHSLLDFTLQFFPIDALLLALLFCEEEPPAEQPDGRKRLGPVCVSLLAGGLCLVMLCSELEVKQMIYAGQRGNWSAGAARYEDCRLLFGDSIAARECYVGNLTYMEAWPQILQITSNVAYTGTEELLMRARALKELGAQDAACELLLGELRQQLHRNSLFELTAQYLTDWGADTQYRVAYNQIVDEANRSITFLGRLQNDEIIAYLN